MTNALAKIVVCLSLLTFVAAGSVSAQSGVYIKLGDIKGEAVGGKFADWIEAVSFDTEWNRPQPTTGSARTRSSIQVGDIIVRKSIDASTPQFMKHAATGAVVKNATVMLVNNGKAVLQYELTNVSVGAYSIIAEATDTIEEVALQFESIEVTYLPNSRSPHSNSYKWNLVGR